MDQDLTVGHQLSELTSSDFKAIFENGPALYLILKPQADWLVAEVSNSFLATLGRQRDEVVGKSFFEVFPENRAVLASRNQRIIRNNLKSVLSQKSPNEIPLVRYDLRNPDTNEYEIRYWTIKNTPVHGHEGEIDYIIFSVNDVTEVFKLAERERLAHEAVELQRKQLYNLFMQTPVAIGIFLGPNHVVELANPTLCALFGRSEDELFSRPIFEVMPESAGRGIEEVLANVLATGKHYIGMEQPMPINRHGEQQTFYFNFVYEPLHEIDGSISGVIVVATDVTEQIHYRHRLEESEHRFKMALELSNLGIWDLDLKQDLITRNKRYAEIFGYQDINQQWSNKSFLDHIVPEDLERANRHFEKAFFRTGKLNMKVRIRWADGTTHWIHNIATVFYDERHEPVRVIGTVQDVTERQEKERHKDEFISAVSHELKTPITSLKAFCQLLQRKFLQAGNEQAAQMLGKMNTQINRLNVIVQDLLDVTRIEGDKLLYRHVTFQFDELLCDIVEEVQRTSETHTIVLESSEVKVPVYADRERIGQVITNLLTNAIKYSPGRDTVTVTLRTNKNEMVCSVRDYGMGIPIEKQESIFERFYRVHDNDPAGGSGLGLGLYICHEIIKRQNGRIWVESDPGEGSLFSFSLPL